MKFRYVGNPRDLLDLHPQITAFGLVFPLDQPIEVTDPRAIGKLKNNTHFEPVTDDQNAPETDETDPAASPPEEAPATPEAPVPPAAAPGPAYRGGRRRS